MTDPIRAAYPATCSILGGARLSADIDDAIAFAMEGGDALREALEAQAFHFTELMYLLGAVLDARLPSGGAEELEENLSLIIKTVGLQRTQSAYRDKLLTAERTKFEDTRYEIAGVAKACPLFDPGSVELEKPLADAAKPATSWKNTDIFGTFENNPVRIDVTVRHEPLPPSVQLELDEIVQSAVVRGTFRLVLRFVLSDEEVANRVKALVELLFEEHERRGAATREIDGVRFEWRRGAYHCPGEYSPIESVTFYDEEEMNEASLSRAGGDSAWPEIIHPCYERNLTPRHILEDEAKPPGVITLADVPGRPREDPPSAVIRQKLAIKLDQCEEGVINIIAMGVPYPMHDRDVFDAVLGASMASVRIPVEHREVRHVGKLQLSRHPKAPFSRDETLSLEEKEAFVAPFQKLSAVWLLRLGTHERSAVIVNPNAARPVPLALAKCLGEIFKESQNDVGVACPSLSKSEKEECEEAVIWPELAEDFVGACEDGAEAKRILTDLKAAGASLDDLRRALDAPRDQTAKGTRYLSPTNEELAAELVLACGGYDEAIAAVTWQTSGRLEREPPSP